MLQAIKGYYDNGVIVLDEQPNLKQKERIIVTFLNENIELEKTKKVRKIGGFEGSIKVPEDFNEPLDNYAITPKKGGIKIGGFEGLVKIPDDFNEPLDDLKEYMY